MEDEVTQLPGLPWVFDASGELQHFLADLAGTIATAADFQEDAIVFERCFALDVRFLHGHCHDHESNSTWVKKVKPKTKEEVAKMLKAGRAPSRRFEFFHIVNLLGREKMVKIRRRGKEIVEELLTGSIALDQLKKFTMLEWQLIGVQIIHLKQGKLTHTLLWAKALKAALQIKLRKQHCSKPVRCRGAGTTAAIQINFWRL